MGFFDKLLGKKGEAEEASDQAVIVHFQYGSTDLQRLFAVEARIEEALAETPVGGLDGNEVAVDGSDGYLYLYGPDADALFAAVQPVLASVDFMAGATVKLRYGPP